jgi:hypothetical protein
VATQVEPSSDSGKLVIPISGLNKATVSERTFRKCCPEQDRLQAGFVIAARKTRHDKPQAPKVHELMPKSLFCTMQARKEVIHRPYSRRGDLHSVDPASTCEVQARDDTPAPRNSLGVNKIEHLLCVPTMEIPPKVYSKFDATGATCGFMRCKRYCEPSIKVMGRSKARCRIVDNEEDDSQCSQRHHDASDSVRKSLNQWIISKVIQSVKDMRRGK